MRKIWLIPAGISLVLAAFMKFALIGYVVTSVLLFCLACLFVVLGLLERLHAKRPALARRLRIALVSVLAVGLAVFTAMEIPVIKNAKTDRDAQAPYLLVLGAGVNGTTPSLSLYNRLSAALGYLIENPDAVAIVSGGQGPGEDITEAEAMRIWLESAGIAPERIIKEEKATSTMENLSFSLDIIESLGGDRSGRVAIVTSEYHLYRAKSMAASLGAQPLGVAAKTTLPVLKINYFIREAFAVAYMKVFG